MRVLFYTGDKQWSGGARVTLTAARGLAAREHQVTVACCSDSQLDARARDAGIDTIAINAGASTPGGAWDLRKVLKERFIEAAIVGTERDHLIVASAMRFAERGGVLRRVPSFAGIDVQRVSRMALKMAAAGVVVTTERELRELRADAWPIPPMVAPLGVDAPAYDAVEPMTRDDLGAPRRGLLIVCSYDPSGRHRMATVFRTLALLAPRHASLHAVVIGPGSTEDDLRMHASALGVSPVVTFLGEVDDPVRAFRAADAGWVISNGDAAALAALDFMALRVPVIAERSPLTQHYVADGITGLLLAPGDPSFTASNVAEFLAAGEKRIAMGNAGRTRVMRDFSLATMIDGFEKAVNAAGDRTRWTGAR
jgi:glycosyltransferase involved in cell wall biosynthesis